MNPYEAMIQAELNAMHTKPSQELREKILQNAAAAEPDILRPVRRKPGLRTLLVAAVLAALSVTTVFAYGDAIRQFMFGDSKIEQVDKLNSGGVYSIGINNSRYAGNGHKGQVTISTIEEARQAAAFAISEPLYLPENASLSYIYGLQYTDDEQIYAVLIGYNVMHRTKNNSSGHMLTIRQYYTGPDAYFELQTLSPIQKVMVGDCEASAIFRPIDADYGSYNIALYWKNGDILYEMTGGNCDLDTMIAIAESM